MRHFYAIASLALLLTLGTGGLAHSSGGGEREIAPLPSLPVTEIVQGKVIRIQGEFLGSDFSTMRDTVYFVHDKYGKNVQLVLGAGSRVLSPIDLGDEIIAEVSQNGLVMSVQKVQ